MRKTLSIVTALVLGLAAGSALAEAPAKVDAKIIMTEGKVLVNRGEGFVAAVPETGLAVGDQIMVGQDASAQLAYGSKDCNLTISAGTLLRISAEAPCKSGESLAMANQTIITPAFFGGTNTSPRLLALIPIAAVGAIVVVAASSYNEPTPASGP